VVGAYSRLAALQKAGIITTGESRALLEGFQSTAIALGASSEQLEQSLFGLAQGLSSGTLRAEELNQIVEPMPGLLQALDRAAALPSGGFRQMVTQGKVTADFFRDCGFRHVPATHSDLIPATDSDRVPATHSDPVPATYSDRDPATLLVEVPVSDQG
jgi:tape measure domain-containing protein